jgi:uncharacterized membrane protein (UPF0127 family)
LRPTLCAFNISKQAFVSLGVEVADTPLARLRGLIGKARMRSDEAVWTVPSRGVHTFGLRFAIDVIYLDARMRVLHVVENLGPSRFSPIRWKCASVLQLPQGSLSASGTQVGDELLICSPQKMLNYWADPKGVGSETKRRDVGKESQPSVTRRAI